MKRRLLYGAATLLLLLCVAFVLWQGSFRTGPYDPESLSQVFLFWAVSTLVFILTVTLGFMLFRTGFKLYLERRSAREGSRMRVKLVAGALALSCLPVVFLVLFSVQVLNFNIARWFTRPAVDIQADLAEVSQAFHGEVLAKADAQARWLAALAVTAEVVGGETSPAQLSAICQANGVLEAWVTRGDDSRLTLYSSSERPAASATGHAMLADAQGLPASRLTVRVPMAVELDQKQQHLERLIAEFDSLAKRRKEVRSFYLLLLALITLFVLFVATWVALLLAKQISSPIAALLEAAGQVRAGNLGYRVRATAVDELAALVRAFNEMTQDLESNQRELERRRRFTEAILENIPSGVLSISNDGRILKVNRAVASIFPARDGLPPAHIEDLFSRDDVPEIRYLLKRARRTGVASRQLEVERNRQKVPLSVLVSALDENVASGYVVVVEDTSEMLRAQKAAAWHEVARRVAHEIKNPLTPISLSADRIARQLEKGPSAEFPRIAAECAATIQQEVETVRLLVDEFAQYSRFPVAHLAPGDLNDVVRAALAVFEGRLENVEVYRNLGHDLPPLLLDSEQMKRVVVNLVDNAAEAMQDSALRRLYVGTQQSTDVVELVVSDTGRGIDPEDREKLFLPYFSTKGRGTGLGLAIVAQILSEHRASIRVEDNVPSGARFVIEIPVPGSGDVPAHTEPESVRETVG